MHLCLGLFPVIQFWQLGLKVGSDLLRGPDFVEHAEVRGCSAGGTVSFRCPIRGIFRGRFSSALPLSERQSSHGRG